MAEAGPDIVLIVSAERRLFEAHCSYGLVYNFLHIPARE